MKPTRDDDAVVDLVDTILKDGAVLQADVVVTVGDVPLVGISLRAAVAGMTTMTEYGHLTEFDRELRENAADRHGEPSPSAAAGGADTDIETVGDAASGEAVDHSAADDATR